MRRLKRTGIWWLPEQSDRKASGDLTFSHARGGELIFAKEVVAWNVEDDPYCLPRDFQIMHGLTTKGEKISLYNCSTYKKLISSTGIEVIEVRAHQVLLGEHAEISDFQDIRKISLSLAPIQSWIRESPIKGKIIDSVSWDFDINLRKGGDKVFRLAEWLTLKLAIGLSSTFKSVCDFLVAALPCNLPDEVRSVFSGKLAI